MSAAKKREKAERREARATQHVLSAMGVMGRRERAQLAIKTHAAHLTAAAKARLDWSDPNALLRAPGLMRETLAGLGVDLQDLDVLVGREGGWLRLVAVPSQAAVDEARRRAKAA